MIRLDIHQPGATPASAELPNGIYLIGSTDDCQIQIPRPEISSRHARLVVAERRVTIMDLGSRNGTFINDGDAIFPNTPHDLSDGARLRIGRAELYVKIPQPVKNPTTPAEPGSVPAPVQTSSAPQPANRVNEIDFGAKAAVPLLLSVLLLVDSIVKLQISIDLKRAGYGHWWQSLLASLVIGVAAVIFILDPISSAASIVILIGGAFLVNGVSDLWITLYVSRKIRDLLEK